MPLSTPEILNKPIAGYLIIGAFGGVLLLSIVFFTAIFLDYNPLMADFLFWDVILLSFCVFMAALNYHINLKFESYKIPQTILFNAFSALTGIVLFISIMNFALPYFPEVISDYKSYSINEVEKNRVALEERGLKSDDIAQYLEDINLKSGNDLAMDTFQKLLMASPFIVFIWTFHDFELFG